MGDTPCRQFFVEPTQTLHRRYEVLRTFFVEQRTPTTIAAQFGLSIATVKSLIRDFRAQVRDGDVPPFFESPRSGDLLPPR